MALRVVDDLKNGAALEDLIKLAVEKATQMDVENLFTSNSIGLLWKWGIRSGDKSHFKTIAKKFTNANTSLLGPSIQYLSQYLSEDQKDEKIGVLTPSELKRVKWLEIQIEVMDKKFSWEMPNAQFSDNEKIPEFLRGPEVSMTSEGVETFKEFQDDQNYAAIYMREEQVHCSFEVEAKLVNGNAFVTFTKTREWFLAQQKKLVQHQTELCPLKDQFGDDLNVDGAETKRTRLDE